MPPITTPTPAGFSPLCTPVPDPRTGTAGHTIGRAVPARRPPCWAAAQNDRDHGPDVDRQNAAPPRPAPPRPAPPRPGESGESARGRESRARVGGIRARVGEIRTRVGGIRTRVGGGIPRTRRRHPREWRGIGVPWVGGCWGRMDVPTTRSDHRFGTPRRRPRGCTFQTADHPALRPRAPAVITCWERTVARERGGRFRNGDHIAPPERGTPTAVRRPSAPDVHRGGATSIMLSPLTSAKSITGIPPRSSEPDVR